MQCHIIPVEPKYHGLVFPELEPQVSLFDEKVKHHSKSVSTSSSKVYLCHSNTTKVVSGDRVLFYRSQDWKSLTVMGIVRKVIRSASFEEVWKVTGENSAYSKELVQKFCNREVLALALSDVQEIQTPVRLEELIHKNILKHAPQSVCSVGSWTALQKDIGLK